MLNYKIIAPIHELLNRQAEQFENKIAFSDSTKSVTYAELNKLTENLATQLKGLGLKEGNAVGVWLPNSVNWVVSVLAIVRAGGIAVPISVDSSDHEVNYRLQDAGCRITFASIENEERLNEIDKNIPQKHRGIFVDAGLEKGLQDFEALCNSKNDDVELVADDIDQASYIVYTSGTTGQPKGVLLTTRGMLWVSASSWVAAVGLNEDDTMISALPLFHSYALNISVLSVLATGSSQFIVEKFSTQGMIDELATGKYTLMPGVPTMFNYLLLACKASNTKPFPENMRCVSAGAIMPDTLNREFEDFFGVELLDGYGITETSTMVTMNWADKPRISGSCGLPLPGLALRIIDPTTNEDVPAGREGELICRGPNVMIGYHNKPEATEKVLQNGWYHSGDLATLDKNGFVKITGRLKEIIIRGGQNIAPAEVEETISTLEEVNDCAVVAMPHETLGEVPVACIVVKEEHAIDAKKVASHCSAHLSSYKVPAEVHFVNEIPRTGSGKTMRFKLQELISKE